MFKKMILTLLAAVLANIAIAQHTKEFTQTDKLFHEGKELFDQRKYSASFRDFEEFLKNTHPTDAGMIMEAEYYMCCNSYELRQSDAKSRLENYLENHPYTPYSDRTQYMLGMLSYESKKYTQALNHFRKIDETHLIDREKIDLLFCRGYANLQTGNTAKALEIFKTLKVMESRYQPTARYYTGYCEYVLGNYEAALPDLLAVEAHPEFEDVAPYYITQIYYSLKNYSEVDKRADFLLKKYPDSKYNAELYRINGERSYATGNYIKAIENLKNYEKNSPTVMRNDMYYLGISYIKTNQSQQAVQYLSKVMTQNDEMSENAYLQLGNAYINSGDKNNARMAFEAATKTNFNNSVREEALYNYALTTYETTTAFGESVKAFEQFIAEFPNSKHTDQAYDYLSTVYLTSKNYRAAYESVSKIKKLNSKLLETKQYLEYQLGTEAFATGNYPKATDFFTKALTSAPNTRNITDIYFWRAESNYRTKDFAKSASDLLAYFNQPNVAKNQNYQQAFYSLGYAYFGQKKYNEALNWFLKYVNQENKTSSSVYSDALNRIGDVYFHSRNFDKATEYYDKANSSSSYNGDYALFQSAYTSGLQKNYNLKITKLEQLMAKYPGSEYGDDALYEIARAYLMQDNDNKAIVAYNRLVSTYPNSNLAPKALLETGMVNFNEKDYTNAIPAFKKVIADYPGSEESNVALESLETIFVEQNKVDEYLSYVKLLGRNVDNSLITREDSLSFTAAEKQYINANYESAISGLNSYITKFCPGGKFCSMAQYYLADCYYNTKDKVNALTAYNKLLSMPGNPNAEEAAMRSAEIAYDQKDYSSALSYFKKLQSLAQTTDNKNIARLGVLRCSFFLNNHPETIKIATEIIADPKSSDDVQTEARLNRAKAYTEQNNLSNALKDLKDIKIDTRTSIGAEAKYMLSEVYFKLNRLNDAESEVLDFAKKNSPYQYWLARSFIVLSDVYLQKGDDFQAKQYLLSLQKNYTVNDDVQSKINERLKAIEIRSSKSIIN